MIIKFTATSGDQLGRTQEYSFFPITIGRYPENDIVITDAIVSRKHCFITSEGEVVILTDLGSTNGTYVNGKKINQKSILADGDTITIGTINLQITLRD